MQDSSKVVSEKVMIFLLERFKLADCSIRLIFQSSLGIALMHAVCFNAYSALSNNVSPFLLLTSYHLYCAAKCKIVCSFLHISLSVAIPGDR